MSLAQKIEKVESNFREIFSRKPKQLSARTFQLGAYTLLHDCLGFNYFGDFAEINQYYSDVYEGRFFGGKPKGFNRNLPLASVEEYASRLKLQPENFSTVAVYKIDDYRAHVHSHCASLEDFKTNKLRSSNFYVSTTIASNKNLMSERFTRILMKNPGELILGLDKKTEKTFSEDTVINYRPGKGKEIFLYTPLQLVDMAKRNINSLSGPHRLATSV